MNTFIRKNFLVILFFVFYCNILADCSALSKGDKEEYNTESSKRLEKLSNYSN